MHSVQVIAKPRHGWRGEFHSMKFEEKQKPRFLIFELKIQGRIFLAPLYCATLMH